MKFKMLFSTSNRATLKVWGTRFLVLLSLSVITVGAVISASPLPPEVVLPSEPLFMNGGKTKGNLMLALSVETPTVGQTYRDDFDENKEYVGYFDPKFCYKSGGQSPTLGYFDLQPGAKEKITLSAQCSNNRFDGNFMNWATSSAIDILRYGLTGGNRSVDDISTTVIDRAWVPDVFYNNPSFFGAKFVPLSAVRGRTELSTSSFPNGMWIYNCRDRVYFANAKDENSTSTCEAPFGVAGALSPNLIAKGGGLQDGRFYSVRNLVCDAVSGPNRLMTYDSNTKKWTGLCTRYLSGSLKPVGQLQVNADSLKVGVTGYTQDGTRIRYGGVLRAPLKYLGAKNFDSQFNLLSTPNARAEWDATTGVFKDNPQNGDPNYGDQGFGQSGVINYINKFGTLNPTNIGQYKNYDPVSELYYETIRYLQGKPPTPKAYEGFTGVTATDRVIKENFPAYTTWIDPHAGFVDTTDAGKGCLRNNILTIADVFTHGDRTLPGNSIVAYDDVQRSAETNPPLNVPQWTKVVGSFESHSKASATLNYRDSLGRLQIAGNLATNQLYDASTPYDLSHADTVDTGAILSNGSYNGGSYYMAGLAYWANTQSFRTDLPKARISSYSIDVNEANKSAANRDFRRTRQLYLAAKYGGFDDSATGSTGNPYANGNNTLWQGSNGDAKNYFMVSDAAKFLDSISNVFTSVVAETGSIAGGSGSGQRVTTKQKTAVYAGGFNPVANFWSGDVLKFAVSLNALSTSVVVNPTPVWKAAQVITAKTDLDRGVSRNIVIGPPIGQQATTPASIYLWSNLATAHKNELNKVPYASPSKSDTLGDDRLLYLRGDRTNEIKPSTPNALFRARDTVMGDIINSGLVYVDGPTGAITDSGYSTFFNANKNRAPVIYVNANDGMLHAINDADGSEAFAYIPGFTAGKMNLLTSQDYSHISINDATPVVDEAYLQTSGGGKWSTVLLSGVGAGGQGVFALDVTDPTKFKNSPRDSVLWEFTDRDHPAMGNVIGTPQIVKLRTTNATSVGGPAVASFKWYAVIASGVNNYKPDGFASTTGNPSIFILDLSRKPINHPTEAAWTEGTNFWRIELPQTSNAIAKGLVGLTTVKNFDTNAVDTLYAGDLQGNLWKLDFTVYGANALTTAAAVNLKTFNAKRGTSNPIFIAKIGTGTAAKLQPITGEPVVTNALFKGKLVSFGTGKFLEASDTTVPAPVGDSFYTLFDNGQLITDRTVLEQATVAASGVVTIPSFVYGMPTPTARTLKMGWFFDFNQSIAERQVSDITTLQSQLFFSSLNPTKGSCGDGGGNLYTVNALTGGGTSEISAVGILAAPLVIEIGNPALTATDATGQRVATKRVAVVTQGSKGIKVAASSSAAGLTYPELTGRLSWRQINNYRENKQ